ncbi:MAG: hypothetical protein M0P64_03920 [Candidatus Pacebacteria bacterium]|nr:hypothetical protein [Candidatus Paceibacterota bacterium]
MFKQNKIKISAIFIFLFSLSILLYWVFFLGGGSKQSRETSVDVLPKLNTSNWLIYKNDKSGYQFKYPQELSVLGGEDPRLGFVDPIKDASFIVLPLKYPNIKSINPSDPKTFLNYTIGIIPVGKPEQYGATIDEILQHFVESTNQVTKIVTADGSTIAIYDDGAKVYFIGKNIVYSLYIEGFNPKDKYAQDWLKSLNNPQLITGANNYPEYSRILEGIYSTFRLI